MQIYKNPECFRPFSNPIRFFLASTFIHAILALNIIREPSGSRLVKAVSSYALYPWYYTTY